MSDATVGGRPGPEPDPRPGPPFGPGGHPTGGVRPYLAAFVVLGGLAAVPIMLSDRAPDLFDRLTDWIEESFFPDIWWDNKDLVPPGDVALHVLLFGALALAIGLLSWSWWTFLIGQAGLLAGGLVLEVLQPVFTSGRKIEGHDVISNVSGQAIGIAVAVGLWWAWSTWEARRVAH